MSISVCLSVCPRAYLRNYSPQSLPSSPTVSSLHCDEYVCLCVDRSACLSVREHISETTVQSLPSSGDVSSPLSCTRRRPSPPCIAMSFSACACLSVGLLVSISPKLRVQSLHLRVSFHLVCRVRVADRLHLSDSARPDSVLPVASQSDPELSILCDPIQPNPSAD